VVLYLLSFLLYLAELNDRLGVGWRSGGFKPLISVAVLCRRAACVANAAPTRRWNYSGVNASALPAAFKRRVRTAAAWCRGRRVDCCAVSRQACGIHQFWRSSAALVRLAGGRLILFSAAGRCAAAWACLYQRRRTRSVDGAAGRGRRSGRRRRVPAAAASVLARPGKSAVSLAYPISRGGGGACARYATYSCVHLARSVAFCPRRLWYHLFRFVAL
jgi:hypothetical protein